MRQEAEGVFPHLAKLLQLVEDDLVLPLEGHAQRDRGGFLGISRQVFCFFDYLGALACTGDPRKNLTRHAVDFMKTYLVRANSAYDGKCALMYHMWRHGTVHERDPKRLTDQARSFDLRWMANNTPGKHNRRWHLKCLCMQNKPHQYHWNINLFELVDDLRLAILHFMSELERDPSKLPRVQKNLATLSDPEELDAGKKPDPSLLTAAKDLITHAARVVDEYGTVIHEFDTDSKRVEFMARWSS